MATSAIPRTGHQLAGSISRAECLEDAIKKAVRQIVRRFGAFFVANPEG